MLQAELSALRFGHMRLLQHKTCLLLLVVSDSRIRSLLLGSGTQSVSAFSYMQDVDYDAAQKGAQTTQECGRAGKRNAKAIKQISS